MPIWTGACATGDIDAEDVIRVNHAGRTFALYRSPEDACYCTVGLAPMRKSISAGGWSLTTPSNTPSRTSSLTTAPARQSLRRSAST